MADYSQLVNKDGTIFNQGARVAYSGSDKLAADLGISASQIDWSKIAKAPTNFDPTGYYGYTAPQTATPVIPADKITAAQPLKLPTPTEKPDVGAGIVAGATQTSKSLQDYINEMTPAKTEAGKEYDAVLSRINELTASTTGKGAALVEAEEKAGVNTLSRDLSALNSEILTKTAEYNKLISDESNKVQSLGKIKGSQRRMADAAASEVGLLQARALGMQGQLESARAVAKRAIDLKYQDAEDELEMQIKRLNAIAPILSKEEAITARAQQAMLDDKKQQMADQKAKQQKLFEYGLSKNVTQPFFLMGKTVVRTSDGKAYENEQQAAADGVDIEKWSNVQVIKPDAGNFQVIGQAVDDYGNNTNLYGFVNEQTGKVIPLGNSFGGLYTPTNNGSLVSSNPNPGKVINGYDFTTYATDPNWGNAVNNILGKVYNETRNITLDQYIQKTAPKSQITSTMIFNAAGKFNVDPELLTAILQHESKFGTLGVGAKTFNPGNVGNTDSGATVNYGNWQAGVDATAQNMVKRQIANQANSPQNSNNPKAIAQTIFNGTGRLSDIATKNNLRTKVAQELEVLKGQALQSGDIYGVIRASAGGKDVDAEYIKSFEKGVNVLYQIADLQKTIDSEATGPVWGIIRSNNPYDTKAQQIKAQLQSIVPNLARGIYGEVGVLTDADIANYSKTLPNLKSTEEVRNAILAMTLKSVQRSLENKIRTAAGFGRDVSGILNMYQSIDQKVKEAEAKLAGTTSGTTDFRTWMSGGSQTSTLDSLLTNKGY